MARRAVHGTDSCAVPTHGQPSPRRRWWHVLVPSHCQLLGVKYPGQTDLYEPWSPEEKRVLQRYHAMNLAAARRATEDLVREGWHTGAVPYGYRSHRIRISPAGRRPRYRTKLLIDRKEASIVEMIFWWFVHNGQSVDEIVYRLDHAHYPAPRRAGPVTPSRWTSASVRAILGNPKYTGYQVWGRTRNGDPEPFEQWVWSRQLAHPAIIDTKIFLAAQRVSAHLSVYDGLSARAA
jgi:hypothetical protein